MRVGSRNVITSKDELSVSKYLVDIYKIPLLSVDEEYSCAIKAVNGDKKSVETLVKSNLRFVVSIAKQYCDSKVKLSDLINEGNQGLILAASKFDPTKGFKFISYAVWWVRHYITEYVNANSRTIRLPKNKIMQQRNINSGINKLTHILGRNPNTHEISEYTGYDTYDVLDSFLNTNVTSYDNLVSNCDNNELALVDTFKSSSKADSNLKSYDKKYVMDRLFKPLKPRDIRIIRLYYGFDNGKQFTLEEIGGMLGISREAVRLSRDKSLMAIKNVINKSELNVMDILI